MFLNDLVMHNCKSHCWQLPEGISLRAPHCGQLTKDKLIEAADAYGEYMAMKPSTDTARANFISCIAPLLQHRRRRPRNQQLQRGGQLRAAAAWATLGAAELAPAAREWTVTVKPAAERWNREKVEILRLSLNPERLSGN